MRLINVHTFKQADRFEDNRTPAYAILSHRWGKNELSYQDFLDTTKDTLNTGFAKIANACAQAKQTGLDWIWIDTCCIDKTSSTELSMSINSMFRWYRDAQVCFAYLDDVNPSKVEDQILKSRWFTRGWTLQEMLASRNLEFFDANWAPLGSRNKLSAVISRATKISPEHLEDFRGASVAQKMSWMADRVTTVDEDTAYCMLGIFDLVVIMDLRYGEGKAAFIRLQEMIISCIPDESIFAWSSDKIKSSGLLAPWPDWFRHSGDIVLRPRKKSKVRRIPYQMTSQGLRFPAPFRWRLYQDEKRTISLSLNCWRMQKSRGTQKRKLRAVVIFVSNAGGYWKRIRCNELGERRKVKTELRLKYYNKATEQIYIPQRDVVTHRLIDGLGKEDQRSCDIRATSGSDLWACGILVWLLKSASLRTMLADASDLEH